MLRLLTNLTGLSTVAPNVITRPPVMMISRQTLLSIATSNSGLFISTLLFDVQHSKQLNERVSSLKLLGHLIVKVVSYNYRSLKSYIRLYRLW
jgi:hypothetical protein